MLFLTNRIGFKLDAIICGFAIGAGFSVIENIFYLARFPELTTSVRLVRGLGTAVMHGATTAILAVTAHELGERSLRRQGSDVQSPVAGARLPGGQPGPPRLQPVPSHPMEVMIATLVIAPVLLIGLMRFGEGKPTNGWPRTARASPLARGMAGRRLPGRCQRQRIKALAARLRPEQAALIRDYCIAKASWCWPPKRKCSTATKLEEGEAERLRAAFARLEQVRKAIGRVGYAALSRICPSAATMNGN